MYMYIYKMKRSQSKPPNACRTGIPAGLIFKESFPNE